MRQAQEFPGAGEGDVDEVPETPPLGKSNSGKIMHIDLPMRSASGRKSIDGILEWGGEDEADVYIDNPDDALLQPGQVR